MQTITLYESNNELWVRVWEFPELEWMIINVSEEVFNIIMLWPLPQAREQMEIEKNKYLENL